MRIALLIISVVLFGMIILGTTSFMGGLASNYDMNVDGSWNGTYNKLEDIQNMTSDISSEMEGGSVKSTSAFASAVEMVYKALRIVYKLPKFLNDIFQNIGNSLGLPDWVAGNLLVIVVIMISIGLASALLGWYL